MDAKRRLMPGLLALAILAIGVLDTLLPRQLSLALFLVVPVFVGVWLGGSRAGVSLALLSSVVWFASDELSVPAEPTLLLRIWDLAVKVSFFLLICTLMRRVKEAADQVALLSRSDELTGAANRRGLIDFAERELERARRYSRPLTLVYLDVDGFKTINDRLGHAGGDRVLRGIAGLLRVSVRKIDLLARVGGDEFVILLTETDAQGAQVATENLMVALDGYLQTTEPPVSVSIGVATFRRPPGSLDAMLKAADALMYAAKASGQGCARFGEYEPTASDPSGRPGPGSAELTALRS